MTDTSTGTVTLPQGGASGELGCREFLNLLEKRQVISRDIVQNYLQSCSSAENLYVKLLESGVKDDDLAKAYAQYLKTEYVERKSIDPEIFRTIPARLIQQYGVLPYALRRKNLKIAISNAYRLRTEGMPILEQLARKSGLHISVAITSSDILNSFVSGQADPEGNTEKTADLTKLSIPIDTLSKLPQEIAGRLMIIAFEEEPGGILKVGAVNPSDPQVIGAIQAIEKENQLSVDIYKINQESFDVAYKLYANVNQLTGKNVSSGEATQGTPNSLSTSVSIGSSYSDTNLDKIMTQNLTSPKELSPYVSTGNVPQIIAAIIKLAANYRASDVHIEAQKDEVLVRYRIDGQMNEMIRIPNNLQEALVTRIKILAKLKIDETRLPQDGRFDVTSNGHDIDVRVSVMPTVFGEKAVLRLLDKNAGLFSLDSLGMTGENYKRFIKSIEKPYGIVMVTGPTGAGKSTSLYAAINHLKRSSLNIVTLEDPVEYEIPGINQIQIKPNIGFTFAEGLSSVLRQDPNIIMVGEIRDLATANLVTHAALTGHLVLTTLHTNNAAGAMPRLINMGQEPFLIASAINSIVGQRLVRKLCSKCIQEMQIPADLEERIALDLKSVGYTSPLKFYHSKGCPVCGGSGYKGRLGIFEVLEVDGGFEQLIIQRASASVISKYAIGRGMYPMKIDGYIKALQGLTSIDEVLRATAIN